MAEEIKPTARNVRWGSSKMPRPNGRADAGMHRAHEATSAGKMSRSTTDNGTAPYWARTATAEMPCTTTSESTAARTTAAGRRTHSAPHGAAPATARATVAAAHHCAATGTAMTAAATAVLGKGYGRHRQY